MDLEAVVWREEGNRIVNVLVVQDVVGYCVQGSGSAARLGNYNTCELCDPNSSVRGHLTPCIALESSIFALGSACCSPLFSAIFLPTNLRFGCLGTATGSSTMPSSTSGPRLVAVRSSSIVLVACPARRGVEVGWNFWPQNVRRAELTTLHLTNHTFRQHQRM